MRVLAIETSCDETAVAVVEEREEENIRAFSVLGNALLSQAEQHAEYGGVFPSLAKREHAKNLVPLTEKALLDAGMLQRSPHKLDGSTRQELQTLLMREPELFEQLTQFLEDHEKPEVDAIAVTEGPGLEPALWVGINFAKALSLVWNVPVIPINHMEGHIVASLLNEEVELGHIEFPALALLISGGHTELVLIRDWFEYELVGSTRDDAVGEAFDKVARMLDLSYPGGPEIARLAEEARREDRTSAYPLPRPMIGSDNCDFSFSGLKTAVLYTLREIEPLTDKIKQEFAREFEDAVVEILLKKTQKAIETHGIRTLILGGGVSANTEIRNAFRELFKKQYPDSLLYIPDPKLTTDNAIMIGVAGLMRKSQEERPHEHIRARGNLKVHT